MAITYAVATNIITVTGFTEAVPCNFTDLYNADKAGTLSLHARVGIAAVDGAAVAVDRAERPTDYVILGGASNDLYITIANWAGMVNATIQIVGTDRDGAAQVENIAVNAAGNFFTTMWFATIVSTQVTVFNGPGGSFDYDLTQGQWGVVWLQNTVQFQLDCRLVVGNNVTETWFVDTFKQVASTNDAITDWSQNAIEVTGNARFRLGEVVTEADKTTRRGCALFGLETTYDWNDLIQGHPNAVVYLYDCLFGRIDPRRYYLWRIYGRIWNCHLGGVLLGAVAADIFHVYQSASIPIAVDFPYPVATFDELWFTEPGIVLYNSSVNPYTISNLYVRNVGTDLVLATRASTGTLIDVDSDTWAIRLDDAAGQVFRQHTFNLRVVDATGAGINGATVAMVDQFGAAVFSVNTGATGDIAEQTVTYQLYAGIGNPVVPTTYSPHTLTISLAGYITRTIVYTMDRAREEIEELLPKGLRKDIEGNLYMEINSVGDLLEIA